MVEYGNGIGSGPGGQVSGSGGSGGGGVNADWGIAIGDAIGNAVDTVAALPAWQLALLVVAIIGGLVFLKRAF